MFYEVLMVFPFPFPPLVVTEVHGRTFGVWTLLTCTLCFLCAFNLENKPLYLATFLSFIYAFGHFLTEYLIYHTMAIANLTTVGIFAGMNVNGLICCRISLMSLLPFALYVGWSCLVIFLDSWHNFHVYFPFFWGGGLGMWSIFPYGGKKVIKNAWAQWVSERPVAYAMITSYTLFYAAVGLVIQVASPRPVSCNINKLEQCQVNLWAFVQPACRPCFVFFFNDLLVTSPPSPPPQKKKKLLIFKFSLVMSWFLSYP